MNEPTVVTNNLPSKETRNIRRLTESEIEEVYEHLSKGGHPTSTHHVLGLSLDELMNEFNRNPEFSSKCAKKRAMALAELEYALHDIALSGDRSALKAIELSLTANFPELYAINTSKAEEKIKKIINK